MLFYLWGVFRGKKKKPSNRIPNNPEKSCVPQPPISSILNDKVPIVENASLTDSIEKVYFFVINVDNIILFKYDKARIRL